MPALMDRAKTDLGDRPRKNVTFEKSKTVLNGRPTTSNGVSVDKSKKKTVKK